MKASVVLTVTLGALLCGGCTLKAAGRQTHSLSNVYRAAPRLPAELHRVAVLPVTVGSADLVTEAGRDALEPVLHAELRKRAVAELVMITREQLRSWTGKGEWTTTEPLPQDFFERLRKATECDAVMFCHLACFRAYPPLGVGWNMQLADVQKHVLWAVDEVFDAGDPAVADAARCYYEAHFRGGLGDTDGILASPRRFGQYAAASALETLPSR